MEKINFYLNDLIDVFSVRNGNGPKKAKSGNIYLPYIDAFLAQTLILSISLWELFRLLIILSCLK